MKPKALFAIIFAVISFFSISWTALAGDQQNGPTYTADYYDGDGNYVVTKTYIHCDPCGSTIRSIFFCNCGGDGSVLITFKEGS